MNATELVARVRLHGGDVRISPAGKLEVRQIPNALRAQLRRNAYLVRAILREQEASRAWESSGRDRTWWKQFGGTTPAWCTCTCKACEFPHVHNCSDPELPPN